MKKHVESVEVDGRSVGLAPDLDKVMVPGVDKKGNVVVDIFQEEIVEKPYMVEIVYVEAIVEFEVPEEVSPFPAKGGGDVDPEPLNTNVVYTPARQCSFMSLINFNDMATSTHRPQM